MALAVTKLPGADTNPDARHRWVGQAHRQQCLDLDPHHAVGLLDAGKSVVVGDAQTVDDLHVGATIGQLLFDLWACARHQHESYPEAVEQRDIVDQVGELSSAIASPPNDSTNTLPRCAWI